MQKVPYPYCKHGVYVGGCGVDHMCMDCELDTPVLTPRQLLDAVVWKADQVERQRQAMAHSIAGMPEASKPDVLRALEAWEDELLKPFHQALREFERVILLATGMDDDKWLDRLWLKHAQAWQQMSGEEQFWSQPNSVLDGA